MTVEIKERTGDGFLTVATYRDGKVEGADILSSFPFLKDADEDEFLKVFDGPNYVAVKTGDAKSRLQNKERIYVDDPSEAPEGVEVQEGQQGGLYYETEQIDGEEGSDEGTPHESWEQSFSLEDSVESQNLSNLGETGNNADNMTVHEMADGSTAYVTEFGDGGADPEGRDQTFISYYVMREVAPDVVPPHHMPTDGSHIAVKGVEGDELHTVRDERAADVDRDAFIRGAAAQTVLGNWDARPQNIIIDSDGKPQFFDLDLGLGDPERLGGVEEGIFDALSQASSSYQAATGEDRADAIDRIAEAAVRIADEIDDETIAGVREYSDEMADRLDAYASHVDEDTMTDMAERLKEVIA